MAVENPIQDWATWNELKDERLSLEDVRDGSRHWPELLRKYRARDYPLALGGYPHGFFGTLVHLMGYEQLFYKYYDEPELIHDMLRTLTEMWIAVYEEVLSQVDVDHVIWEDISAGKGSMVAPDHPGVHDPVLQAAHRVPQGARRDHIFVDTDGDCNDLIPLFMDAGMTGMYPMEASCGMDIVKVRKRTRRSS